MDLIEHSAGEYGGAGGTESDGSSDNLSSIFFYPHLETLFNGKTARALPVMRKRLQETSRALERVARTGAKVDADRAADALRAYAVVEQLLDELEQARSGTEAPRGLTATHAR